MSLVLRVGVLAFGVALAIAACGGTEKPTEDTASAAASCSPPPSPSCSPGEALTPESSPSPSSSPTYGTTGGGLRADGLADDICSFIKWVCKRKKANTPGGQCSGGAPTTCKSGSSCWLPDGAIFCTEYSCAGVADGSPPNISVGYQNGTGCQLN
ncbi:MAG: hypothetical protein U1E65_09490 [Myxococcota bacterium]